LTSAADAPERDPAAYKLEGSNDGTNFVAIADGPIPTFSGRSMRQEITFTNTNMFSVYRLGLPSVVDPGASDSLQLAEIELLGILADSGSPYISIVREGAVLRLSYRGILESAEQVSGPYNLANGGTSPRTVSPEGSARFYRVR
jgi:hypothetical protein